MGEMVRCGDEVVRWRALKWLAVEMDWLIWCSGWEVASAGGREDERELQRRDGSAAGGVWNPDLMVMVRCCREGDAVADGVDGD